jgi:cellulose synthase/poly-beta-1,6-N-acetylglucosamine synthase-like glycosyltransferase
MSVGSVTLSDAAALADRGRARDENFTPICIGYTVGVALSALLMIWTPVRFATWAMSLDAAGGSWVAASAILLLGVVSAAAGFRWLVMFSLSYRSWAQIQRVWPEAGTNWPLVSVLVPAYNESETIAPALESLLALDYPNLEILVIDDGSTDDTHNRAMRFVGDHDGRRVRVLRKPNGGKWSALNLGFYRARAELLLCVDADSRLDPRALRFMVMRMMEPGVDAVAGQVRVRNRKKLITRFQGLEYLISNGALRFSQSRFGTVLVVPGPIGLFRRSILEQLCLQFDFARAEESGRTSGPFQPDTFAEDFDLSLSILSLRGRTVYEPRAISTTQAPDTLQALLNQRYRWCRGTIQVLRKHIRRVRRDPTVSFFRLNIWLCATYAVDLVLQPIAVLAGMASLFYILATETYGSDLFGMVLLFQLTALSAGITYCLMHRDRLRMLLVVPLYDLYQGLVINSAWVISVFDEVRNARMRW